MCSIVKNSVQTTAERLLQLSIVSSSRLCFELETRSQAGKSSFSSLGAKYTILITMSYNQCNSSSSSSPALQRTSPSQGDSTLRSRAWESVYIFIVCNWWPRSRIGRDGGRWRMEQSREERPQCAFRGLFSESGVLSRFLQVPK
jgi:hypothetical protein